MLKLKHENFIKARNYIFVHGDDINRAWFRYLFEGNDENEFLKGSLVIMLVVRQRRGFAEIANQKGISMIYGTA